MANSRFAVATHIMVGIAQKGDEGPVSSAYLAGSVNTNPVVVRRIMQDLVRAGLLKSKSGKGGGATLAVSPRKMNLHQIYKAVQKEGLFEFNPNEPNQKCPLSCRMKAKLEPVFAAVDKGLEERLRRISVWDLMQD